MESTTTLSISVSDGKIGIPAEILSPEQLLALLNSSLNNLRRVLGYLPELKPLKKFREVEQSLAEEDTQINAEAGITVEIKCLRLGVLERSDFPPSQDGCTLSQKVLFMSESGELIIFGQSRFKRNPDSLSLRHLIERELLDLFARRPKAVRAILNGLASQLLVMRAELQSNLGKIDEVTSQVSAIRNTLV